MVPSWGKSERQEFGIKRDDNKSQITTVKRLHIDLSYLFVGHGLRSSQPEKSEKICNRLQKLMMNILC